jgi:alginate O-acetyltransferase complex protein AlgI
VGRKWSRLGLDWLPLALLPLAAWYGSAGIAAWARMWLLAGTIFAACKWLTWRRAVGAMDAVPVLRSLGYVLAWPGMNAEEFLDRVARPPAPRLAAWVQAAANTSFGAVLIWGVARIVVPLSPWAGGWVGLVGLAFLLHFGVFRFLALVWQRCGVSAEPIMRCPIAANSLSDFWGRRWNLAFRRLAHEYIFLPLTRCFGPRLAMVIAFAASGLLHEAVISLPAGGGYGLPMCYFLLQAGGLAAERSTVGRRVGLGRGVGGRLIAAAGAASHAADQIAPESCTLDPP